MSHRQSLKLSNLYLDIKNPRYEEQKSQNEALNTIAKEQGQKLLVLLKDVIDHGLNPTDIPIVMPVQSKENGFIVLEGNRRIAALKLFKKPAILTSNALRQKFGKLHDQHKNAMPKSIECWVVDSREEASIWIERKHEGEMNGAGTVRWDSVQKGRFLASKTGKDTRALQLIDFMKAAGEGDNEFTENLKKVSSTNIERLFGTPDVCASLGLEYSQGEYTSRYEWNEVLKGLKAVVKRMSQNDFRVTDIYHKSDRLKFIADIPVGELPDKTKKADGLWKLKDYVPTKQETKHEDDSAKENGKDAEKDNGKGKVDDGTQQERPTSRDTFLPDSLTLSIPNDRINRIYSELKLLSHINLPNTCGVMMRVFLELSVDKYMEAFKLLKNDALTGARDRRDLKQKTNEVIHHMIQTKRADEAITKGMKTVANKDNSSFSIDTMNAFVHNGDFNPIPDDVMLTWDNIQPFIITLWKALSEKE